VAAFFSSYEEAFSTIPTAMLSGYGQCYQQAEFYDASNKENAENMKVIDRYNKSIDYPVLVWLREAFTDSSKVFDLGGNMGYGYYSYQRSIPYPATLSWTVCELPEVVEAGKRMLKTIDSPGLSYTTDVADAEGSEILLTCGTLQYLEPSLAKCLEPLATKPRHLIVHNVPMYDGEEYFTHQNLIPACAPYKIQNRSQFLASLNCLGYEVIDSWEVDRTCRIPFHPERFVKAYCGFYLRKM
ncbi:MAG: methyltransferase, TIGR04325 family, partial [Leptolyngbyaceae cyanobacterium SM1_3_5]|nr:methyltransferase, TIGR04325 family [Leptolyngbyaceae cyanobacterium SM1_3_5]